MTDRVGMGFSFEPEGRLPADIWTPLLALLLQFAGHGDQLFSAFFHSYELSTGRFIPAEMFPLPNALYGEYVAGHRLLQKCAGRWHPVRAIAQPPLAASGSGRAARKCRVEVAVSVQAFATNQSFLLRRLTRIQSYLPLVTASRDDTKPVRLSQRATRRSYLHPTKAA